MLCSTRWSPSILPKICIARSHCLPTAKPKPSINAGKIALRKSGESLPKYAIEGEGGLHQNEARNLAVSSQNSQDGFRFSPRW